jgi:hypothetical protein
VGRRVCISCWGAHGEERLSIIIRRLPGPGGVAWIKLRCTATLLDPEIQHTCALPTCSVSLIDPNHAVNHAAWHRLFTPLLLPEDETCALCLGPAAACPSYIVKTSSLQPRIFCVMFSPGALQSDAACGVKFTYSGMSNSSAGLPSTNFPIVFPVCEPTLADAVHKLPSQITNKKSTKKLSIMRPAVMKYNFRAPGKISRDDGHASRPVGRAKARAERTGAPRSQ